METQTDIFRPKYFFTTYLKVLMYSGFFVILLYINFQRQDLNWQIIFLTAITGFVAILEVKSIIKEVEFNYFSMVIRYYAWPEKEIKFHDIQDIEVNTTIRARGMVILLREMTNRMELQRKVAGILLEKKIKKIDIDEKIEEKRRTLTKILKISLISTAVIGIMASFILEADLATWAFLLFILFFLIFLGLTIFIRS